jgi:2-methylcitrate dehydratase PrpD
MAPVIRERHGATQGISDYLVARSRAVEWDKLSPEVVEVACQCVLDWLGGAISQLERRPLHS